MSTQWSGRGGKGEGRRDTLQTMVDIDEMEEGIHGREGMGNKGGDSTDRDGELDKWKKDIENKFKLLQGFRAGKDSLRPDILGGHRSVNGGSEINRLTGNYPLMTEEIENKALNAENNMLRQRVHTLESELSKCRREHESTLKQMMETHQRSVEQMRESLYNSVSGLNAQLQELKQREQLKPKQDSHSHRQPVQQQDQSVQVDTLDAVVPSFTRLKSLFDSLVKANEQLTDDYFELQGKYRKILKGKKNGKNGVEKETLSTQSKRPHQALTSPKLSVHMPKSSTSASHPLPAQLTSPKTSSVLSRQEESEWVMQAKGNRDGAKVAVNRKQGKRRSSRGD